MEPRKSSKLAVILHADIAGSTTLVQQNEHLAHERIQDTFRRLGDFIDKYFGCVHELRGDALLAEFERASDAVSAVLAFQAHQAKYLAKHTDNILPLVRTGIALGEVLVADNTLTGAGVVLAQRIEQLAEPGGLCITAAIHEALPQRMPFDQKNLGDQHIKGFDEKIKIYAVGLNPDAEIPEPESPSRAEPEALNQFEKPSIVVLPFTNMSGDKEQEYFADGITEEIITGLGRFREIIVVAQGSAFAFKGETIEPTEAARKLDVEYALVGTVRKAGNRVRIAIRLIDGESGHQICAEQYDRELDDIFAVQDDVSQRLVTLLAGRIEEQGKARAMRKNTRNLSAYDFWLQGKYYLRDWKGSNEDIIKAREMFENAIELDADYAAAYAGLAGTYILEFENSWTDTPVETGQIALELARKAASLDDQDSWVHLVLALAYRDVKSDFELANAQVRTAIELNPNHYWNYCFKSWLSTCSGDLEEGIFCGNEAIRRNPLLPDGCLTSMVFAEYLSGRYDQAIETFGKMINPDFRVQACLAACYAQLGRHEDARRAAEEFRKCTGDKDKIELDENWNDFWSAMFKFKNPEAIDHLLEGMSKAGLPGE